MFLCLNTFTEHVRHGLLRAVLVIWRGSWSGWPGDQPLSWELFASTSSAPTPGIYLTFSRLPALTTFQRLGGDLPPDSGKLTCRGPKAHLALGR